MARSAYQAALRMLGRRDFFAAELADRLRRAEFDPEEIEEALERCADAGLLDDEKLAARFVELRGPGRGWGPRRLVAEMQRRGADPDVAERAAQIDEETFAEALRTALRRAEGRQPPDWWSLPRGRARMVSSLFGRGFDSDVAVRAVADVAAERERQHDEVDDQPGDPVSLP